MKNLKYTGMFYCTVFFVLTGNAKETEKITTDKLKDSIECSNKSIKSKNNYGLKEEEVEKLLSAAKEARKNSYSPYSNFPVGAAVLTEGGKIYTGTNVENSSFPLGNCAETVAINKAVSEGERKITAIAVVLDAPEYGAPCGACRQVINEFAKSDEIPVIMGTVNGNHKIKKLSKLLAYSFKLNKEN
jgi:cytidine deaminase